MAKINVNYSFEDTLGIFDWKKVDELIANGEMGEMTVERIEYKLEALLRTLQEYREQVANLQDEEVEESLDGDSNEYNAYFG